MTCLTPGTRQAIATAWDDVGDYVWSVELAEVDWGEGLAPWSLAYLFSAMLTTAGGHNTGTIATAKIDALAEIIAETEAIRSRLDPGLLNGTVSTISFGSDLYLPQG